MISRFKPFLGWQELFALFRLNKDSVRRFEKAFAEHFQAKDAVAFPYGRSGQWAFFKALGIENAEIIMPAYTCSVVAHAVTLSGNSPKFVDIKLDDFNMDLDLVAAAINERTRVIIATHTFGYPQDIDRLQLIVKDAEHRYGHKIWLMQDCCHAFGATWNGKLIGTSGDVAVFAFNISKLITSIFGGMLTFQDQELADKIRIWRNKNYRRPGVIKGIKRRFYLLAIYIAFHKTVYGITRWLQEKTHLLNIFTKAYHLDEKIHFPPDYLDFMIDVEASVGLEQLKKYPDIISIRRKNAQLLNEKLRIRQGWKLPRLVEGATYSHYPVIVSDKANIIKKMNEAGIELGELIQYSIPNLNCYVDLVQMAPVSEFCSNEHIINIPIYCGRKEMLKIIEVINTIE
jgi:perosamine synthetase